MKKFCSRDKKIKYGTICLAKLEGYEPHLALAEEEVGIDSIRVAWVADNPPIKRSVLPRYSHS